MVNDDFKKKGGKKKKRPKGRVSYPDPTTPSIPKIESPKSKEEKSKGFPDPTIF